MNHPIDDWLGVGNGLWIRMTPIGGQASPHPSPGGGISVSIQMEEKGYHVDMDPHFLLLLAAAAKEAEEPEAG